MLLGVELVAAGLADGHDQASSEAAAHENGHDAEVEDHGSLGVHMLNFNIFLLA